MQAKRGEIIMLSKKLFSVVAFIILLFVMLLTTSNTIAMDLSIQRKSIDVNISYQHKPVWCWAATIAMVAQWLQRVDIDDCQVLAEYDMRLGGRGLCCLQAPECIRTGQSYEMENILENIFNVSTIHNDSPVDFDTIASEIDAGRPLIAALHHARGGHVVVISGYQQPNRVKVLDPINGTNTITYDTFVNNWQYGQWVETFTFSTDRADSPRCRRELEPITLIVPGPCPPYWLCSQDAVRPRLVCD